MTTTIKIHTRLNAAELAALRSTWSTSQDASIVLPLHCAPEEVNRLVKFLGEQLPDEFSSTILADLIEEYEVPIQVLAPLFDRADIGLQVTICTRPDINKSLFDKCLNSTVPEVVEHVIFNNSVSLADCERLLTTSTGKAAENAIRRAMEIKRRADEATLGQ